MRAPMTSRPHDPSRTGDKLLLRALRRQPTPRPPVWLMRQAGRYLPEYQAVRQRAGGLLPMMRTPDLAAEITLQPVRRFDVDAAILFSDILLPLDAMGMELRFEEGRGPVFTRPLRTAADIAALSLVDPAQAMPYVGETLRLVRSALPGGIALLGFCGAPFTLASYALGAAGGASRAGAADDAAAAGRAALRDLMDRQPAVFKALMDKLATVVGWHLRWQVECGADAVVLFDTWAGQLTREEYLRCAAPWTGAALGPVSGLAPRIGFVLGGGHLVDELIALGVEAVALDARTDLGAALARVGHRVAVQGNLDPQVLLRSPDEVTRAARAMLATAGGRPGYIASLGHGVLKETDPACVAAFVEAVRASAAPEPGRDPAPGVESVASPPGPRGAAPRGAGPRGDDALVALAVDEETLQRLAGPGPRYTSYPTAPDWSDAFGEADALAAYQRAGRRAGEPLSLYVHLPFCERLCLYCGCTVEISSAQGRADSYLDALEREVALVSAALGERRGLVQMHWGGGTPTFLSPAQIGRLHGLIGKAFRFLPGGEQSVEVDPHVTTPEQVDLLCSLGFNRVSLGVQDFDETVQRVVHRDQTVDETVALVERFRARGVQGVNVDLMYGLPEQTPEGFAATLDRIVAMAPDRLAVFGYAHVPWMKPAQKALERLRLPTPVERARLFGLALSRLGAAGYEVIGLDHFARRGDPLWDALQAGRLHRNFMGYATQPAQDMVGLGMSAIGDLGGAFLQNARTTKEYEPALAAGHLATRRGLLRTDEDELRRATILSLMCRMRVDLDELEAQTGRAGLAEHFATEWRELEPFAADGFCTLESRRLDVTPRGRLFLRHMAMVFDAHLRAREPQARRFSQTV